MSRPKLTPQIAFNLAKALYDASGERDERLESVIVQDSYQAYRYAYGILKAPWAEAEPVIARDKSWAKIYIRDVLKTRKDKDRFREVQRWVAQS